MVSLYVVVFVSILSAGLKATADVYTVDHSQDGGRRFDGIGGLSGGGATSKLLVNYPEEQRDQILDYLFKPGFGASLHILKVEIGGDAQSTDGSESSHMHNSWDENYERGYEWWLMTEAKKRNPDILLYCLPWAFPAWVGAGTRSPYHAPEVTASYVVKYILGAKKHYNLTMDYVGIWNERPYNSNYIKVLRQSLDTAGLKHTRIVAADGTWEPISLDIQLDEELSNAVDFIGVHYPGTKGSQVADKTGKQLWSSEDYSTFNDNVGAGCWARILNQNYVNGNMTSTISWNLIASYYEALPFKRNGLMTADSPWSGFYTVESPIWITAHTTQFAWPGWNYAPHGSGSSLLKYGGSMVSLASFDSSQLTIVIETMSRNHSICVRPFLPEYNVTAQNITIQLTGFFAQLFKMNVWYSKLGFDEENSTFMKNLGSVPVIKGKIVLSVGVDEVYTLTTLETGKKGNYPDIPPIKPFPLPYQDNFEAYAIYKEPFNFSPQVGTFEVRPSGDGNHSKVLSQVVIENPIFWCLFIDLVFPIGLLGDDSWSDIYVEADTKVGPVNGTSGVFVAARIDKGGCSTFEAEGVYFFLFPKTNKIEVTGDLARTQKLFMTDVSVSADQWNNLGLLIKDGHASGTLNGKLVFNITAPAKPENGFVGLGTSEYGLADFDNLKIMSSSDGEHWMKGKIHRTKYTKEDFVDHLDNIDEDVNVFSYFKNELDIEEQNFARDFDSFSRNNIENDETDDTLYFKSSQQSDKNKT